MSHAKSLADLPDVEVRLLEKLCDDFERAWREALRNGLARPRLEDAQSRLSTSARTLGIRELALVEIGQRRQHGEQPTREDYFDRPPDISGVFNALLERAEGAANHSTGLDDSEVAADETDLRMADDSIPGYRLVRRVGSGGIGEVFLAIQLFSTPDDARANGGPQDHPP